MTSDLRMRTLELAGQILGKSDERRVVAVAQIFLDFVLEVLPPLNSKRWKADTGQIAYFANDFDPNTAAPYNVYRWEPEP